MDYLKLVASIVISTGVFALVDVFLIKNLNSGLLNFFAGVSTALVVIFLRMAYFVYMRNRTSKKYGGEDRKRALIVGAGYTAKLILTELTSGKSGFSVIAIVDDDVSKQKRNIAGVSILGSTGDIPTICAQLDVDVIIFAIPSADEETRKRILNVCITTGCVIKVIPYVSSIIENAEMLSQMRDVNIEDLLGRRPVELDGSVIRFIEGKTCMVTGGGGSIGSELCRQIAKNKPARLVIVDNYENNLYQIEQELIRDYGGGLCFEAVVANVADPRKLEKVFLEGPIDIIFHAAAHKHVPLMEKYPEEAVKNNIVGTRTVAELACRYNVGKFIMISTDKAVNPTNVMGASKRVCEMIVSSFAEQCRSTEYASVRFGNVLGSNGSVIPLFREQIRKGGPVTVTHPDIIRYFMTIPEAVSLVLTTGALARGGEIFVLDLGNPV
jgi:FlaA1/EpsC-like NDP-sugar epimerase